MSNIQLSEELLIDIQKTLVTHDPKAQDMGVAVQYLSAITGLLLANFNAYNREQKKELLQQLFGFTENVMNDNDRKNLQNEDSDAAFGIWKPE
ncbi:MAG TPA: hypothetical protein ENI65_01030 [Gammaproteobacteria bacterium]|nr:hypothetical protein [Gammaproteobacteria bacterium]